MSTIFKKFHLLKIVSPTPCNHNKNYRVRILGVTQKMASQGRCPLCNRNKYISPCALSSLALRKVSMRPLLSQRK